MSKSDNHKRFKPVPIVDQAALKLIHQRARLEHRTLSNAAATSVIERLDPKFIGQRAKQIYGIDNPTEIQGEKDESES